MVFRIQDFIFVCVVVVVVVFQFNVTHHFFFSQRVLWFLWSNQEKIMRTQKEICDLFEKWANSAESGNALSLKYWCGKCASLCVFHICKCKCITEHLKWYQQNRSYGMVANKMVLFFFLICVFKWVFFLYRVYFLCFFFVVVEMVQMSVFIFHNIIFFMLNQCSAHLFATIHKNHTEMQLLSTFRIWRIHAKTKWKERKIIDNCSCTHEY